MSVKSLAADSGAWSFLRSGTIGSESPPDLQDFLAELAASGGRAYPNPVGHGYRDMYSVYFKCTIVARGRRMSSAPGNRGARAVCWITVSCAQP